jgi:hypothetical protein
LLSNKIKKVHGVALKRRDPKFEYIEDTTLNEMHRIKFDQAVEIRLNVVAWAHDLVRCSEYNRRQFKVKGR